MKGGPVDLGQLTLLVIFNGICKKASVGSNGRPKSVSDWLKCVVPFATSLTT